MTPRSLPRSASTTLARRGILLASPALLLAGCGLMPGGDEASGAGAGEPTAAGEAGDAGSAEGGNEETAAAATSTSAVTDVTVLEVQDEVEAGGLMQRLEDSETLRHPYAAITVTATALLESLTAEQFTALTGEEVPPADGQEDAGGEPGPATELLPGELKKFLLASWESTDSEWAPDPSKTVTELCIAYGGNDDIRLESVEAGDTERNGTVLAIVDATPAPSAVTVRASMDGGVQEISLVDGTIVASVAPRMYERGLEVQISEAGTLDTEVPDGFAQDVMTLRGTVDEAFLSPYVKAGVGYGGNLGWAAEEEIHLVIPLNWQRDSSSNVEELTEVRLILPDGSDLRPAQDQFSMFGGLGDFIATFTIPASSTTATLEIMPRFGQILDEDFEQVEETLTATLTFP